MATTQFLSPKSKSKDNNNVHLHFTNSNDENHLPIAKYRPAPPKHKKTVISPKNHHKQYYNHNIHHHNHNHNNNNNHHQPYQKYHSQQQLQQQHKYNQYVQQQHPSSSTLISSNTNNHSTTTTTTTTTTTNTINTSHISSSLDLEKKVSDIINGQSPSQTHSHSNYSTSNRTPITPDQWSYMGQTIRDIAPLINALKNKPDDFWTIANPIQHNIGNKLVDGISDDIDDDQNSSHSSDDDVLDKPKLIKNPLVTDTINSQLNNKPGTGIMNATTGSAGHQYQSSITGSFDPSGYDHVVSALHELKSFFVKKSPQLPNIQHQQVEPDIDMDIDDDDDHDHDSDDEVLAPDFDNNNNNVNNVNKMYISAADEEEEEDDDDNDNANNNNNIGTEYDDIVFKMANKSFSKSKSISKSKSKSRSRSSKSKSHKSQKNNRKSNNNNNNNNENIDINININPHIATPIPINRSEKHKQKQKQKQKRMQKRIQKSPKSSAKAKAILLNNKAIFRINNNKLDPISITPKSYLTPVNPTQLIQHQHIQQHKPLSPSHSVLSVTEISMDNTDQYEYQIMSDGGMKRISQSYKIAPIKQIFSDNNNNNNNNKPIAKSREISKTVDIIMEEEDLDDNNNINNSKQIIKQKQKQIGSLLPEPTLIDKSSSNITIPINKVIKINKNDILRKKRYLKSMPDVHMHATQTQLKAIKAKDNSLIVEYDQSSNLRKRNQEIELQTNKIENNDDDIDDDIDDIDETQRTNKWCFWIVGALLSISFICGVFIGFGISWFFFLPK